ncbi:MAG: translational GTPase TypA [Armatimonadetes bacterium]|nr:translational GTPase TypA [Armatimonadota bacterium]
MLRNDVRNVAIIAHIDHGKTTLVDGLLRQSGVFRPGQAVVERVMDSNDLERERGITILSKNTSIEYRGVTINIVDTPGHVDFSGEVERILGMVDGAILVVDAAEGPMAQTRFVVKKALDAGLVPILVVNKIDRADARPAAVVDEVLGLFMDLDSTDEQISFPIVYASARDQVAGLGLEDPKLDLQPLFQTIVEHVPAPEGNADRPLQLLVSSLDYDDYIGRLAIGRIQQGRLAPAQAVVFGAPGGALRGGRIGTLFRFSGLKRVPVDTASAGDIVVVSGLAEVALGETITEPDAPSLLPGLAVDEPTLAMTFQTTDSPLAGREGRYVTSRQLAERLYREREKNVALRVEPTDSPDVFDVCGRGELHLSILLETMRREGFELCVSSPRVIKKEENGRALEPFELLTVDLPEEYLGAVMERLGERRADMQSMSGSGTGRLRLEFLIPMRGLIGFRSELLTLTRGYGIMNHLSAGFFPERGEIAGRSRGALVASESGLATGYALNNLQDRGIFFIDPGEEVYAGMVVGEHCRPGDLEINVCKRKHVTNVRRSTAEQGIQLEVPRRLSLEQALEYIAEDELVEVTPKSIRVRKAVLDTHKRARLRKEKALRAAAS